ncbi:MAG: response regulator, partial [Armatimonadetes bacterium]|nr:response regulator [Armatimonadota bacterium]
LFSEALAEMRTLYTSEVVETVRAQGIPVSHDYKKIKGAIPLPATLSMRLGNRLAEKGSGGETRLYSDYPFPGGTGKGPQDDFEREALQHLRADPKQPYWSFTTYNGRYALRYATADVMRPTADVMRPRCVNCHNSHPDSPRRDWKVGDVRGALEVITPMEAAVTTSRAGLRGAFGLLGGISLVGLLGLVLVINKLRSTNVELEDRVAARTLELTRANTELEEEAQVRRRTEEELVIAKEAAEGANRAKSQFLANMSHELRTPMNAIIGYSEMLQEEAVDGGQEDLIPDLARIHSAGKHLLGLINDILDLSKIEAGKMELFLETIEIKTMIEEVVSTIRPLIEQNANTLTVKCEASIGSMHADLTKIRQALFNLLSNASKFTDRGSVELTVERISEGGRQWITFAVKDSGIGLDGEQLLKLFQPFSQAEQSTTRKYGGTGLGLTITRRFCQMMGGEVTVSSALGQGSTFTIKVPAEVARAPLLEEPGLTETPPPTLRPHSALVIDDDEMVRSMMSRMLTADGFGVMLAETGEEGLRIAREHRPDVIVLDVVLPGMDGWAVLKHLKADPDLAETPVVIVSMLDDNQIGMALGAAEYITKPLDRDQLRAVIARHRRPGLQDVLLVEDNPPTRELIRRTLEKEGWTVTEAANGRLGLERLREKTPDVIVLDLMMPEMDGFEFLMELRRNEAWRNIPVVVATAKDLTDEDRARLNGSVQKILQKGAFAREELLTDVLRLVKERVHALPVKHPRATVLSIDDEAASLDLIRRCLGREGYHVVSCSDPEECLRLARTMNPDVITLDVMMPGRDGWTVLITLKGDAATADIPVVMLTIVDDRNKGMALGASDYLTKPFDRDRLVAAVERLVREDRRHVLVVDDDPAARDLVRRLLERDHWTVQEASNGREALERIGVGKPGVILLDLMMPEMDGFEFLTNLHEVDPSRSIPVIVVTAKDLDEADRARLDGAVRQVLQKGSFSQDELMRTVVRLVSRSVG